MKAPHIAAKYEYCRIASNVPSETFYINFGVADNKGRTVGARYSTSLTTYEPTPQEELDKGFLGYDTAPGTYYTLHCSATRGGDNFGAWQAPRDFATAALRQKAIHKYINAARKRAVKNFDFVGPVTQV